MSKAIDETCAGSNVPDAGEAKVPHDIHQPRARKPFDPRLARGLHGELSVPATTPSSATASVPDSESGTPAPPDDAAPSVKATSIARKQNRRKTRQQRIFPSVDYEHRLSYFDPKSSYSKQNANLWGFFVLFWIGLAIMVITTTLRNLKETGTVLNFRQWPLFIRNIEELAISDGLMCASTIFSLPLNRVFLQSRGILRWKRAGMIIQSLFQATWLWFWISTPFIRDWTWTAQVFFTLHTLTLFMKMHSYGFYNGHLSTTLQRLKELDLPIGPQTPTTAAVRYPSSHASLVETKGDDEEVDSREHISPIMRLREDLATELTSPLGNVTYPENLTAANYFDFIFCPTLCYELEYPRMKRSFLELFWKTLAVFGCIFLMTVTSEAFIIPVLDESSVRLQLSRTWVDSSLIFAETVSSLLFPFMVTFLLTFLAIFEYCLGAFAEITGFADRQFYTDWWNSLDWLEFSREWNIPVYLFLKRHVYSASRGAQLSKPIATVITFLVSALAHELIMGCITRKFRGYGFVLMMMQIPLVMIQRLPFVKHHELLNNVMFWISMIMGLSLLCALYVLV